jgi:predicted transcriptional regulator
MMEEYLSTSESAGGSSPNMIDLTASIVTAYVGHNQVALDSLPGLIKSVHDSFAGLGTATPIADAKPQPAVPVKKSVHPDYLICLEDGKRLKMLKRHLQTQYSMTPDDYRLKWGLPADYPMVAPNYAQQRSTLAKKIGLGQSKPAIPVDAPTPSAEPAKRGRKKASA